MASGKVGSAALPGGEAYPEGDVPRPAGFGSMMTAHGRDGYPGEPAFRGEENLLPPRRSHGSMRISTSSNPPPHAS